MTTPISVQNEQGQTITISDGKVTYQNTGGPVWEALDSSWTGGNWTGMLRTLRRALDRYLDQNTVARTAWERLMEAPAAEVDVTGDGPISMELRFIRDKAGEYEVLAKWMGYRVPLPTETVTLEGREIMWVSGVVWKSPSEAVVWLKDSHPLEGWNQNRWMPFKLEEETKAVGVTASVNLIEENPGPPKEVETKPGVRAYQTAFVFALDEEVDAVGAGG